MQLTEKNWKRGIGVQYIDSNVFITAVAPDEKENDAAARVLSNISSGKFLAATSYLTIDEVTYRLISKLTFEEATKFGRSLLNMPNLRFIEVNEAVTLKALDLMEQYKLDPRDSIHAASMLIRGITQIISNDTDFDRVKEITRHSVTAAGSKT
ncbi:type II toxin-antitoxin system VapC family toxin [archaeon]|nr:type II toxin-antitoxin system VapC family toxin [archaeon]